MDHTKVYKNLYIFITNNGGRTPAEALRYLQGKPSRIREDLHAAYGPYGWNWAHSDNMPSFEHAIEILNGEIAQRLRNEL